MRKSVILQNILHLIQGALIGVGAILPGVSGGVLCVAFGIYEPMMELLTHPKEALRKNCRLFIPIGIGWIAGFILLARAVELLFAVSAPAALMLFFGLICGTLPELFKTSEKSDPGRSWTPFILALALAYLFFHLLEGGISTVIAPSFGSYVLCGLLWGLSLIIPGLSSSSILIYLGLYAPMTAGIAALDFGVLIPLLLGIVATALLFARLVDMLFKKHYALISRIVLGFVIASSLKIIPASFDGAAAVAVALVCFAAGFAGARAMDVLGKKQEAESAKG